MLRILTNPRWFVHISGVFFPTTMRLSAIHEDVNTCGVLYEPRSRQRPDALLLQHVRIDPFCLSGESDSGKAKDAAAYHSNLQELVRAVRDHFEVPRLPFVAAQIAWAGKMVAVVDAAIQQLAHEDLFVGCCAAPEQPLAADGHLSKAAVCTVGRRMAIAVESLTKGAAVTRQCSPKAVPVVVAAALAAATAGAMAPKHRRDLSYKSGCTGDSRALHS